MRGLLVALCALLVLLAAGCTRSAPSTEVQTTTLLEKYKEKGTTPKVTVLFFITRGCPPNMLKIRDFLQGLENLSSGEVKFFEVDAERDREGKSAYGIVSFPGILFFNDADKLKEHRGPGLDMETAKEIVTGLGVSLRAVGGEQGHTGALKEQAGR